MHIKPLHTFACFTCVGMFTYTYTNTHTYTHQHTWTHKHVNTHTHTHTHTHTQRTLNTSSLSMPSQLGAVWAETHCCLHQWCWSTSPPCAQSQPLCPWLLSKACKAYAASGRGIITPAYCTSPPPAAGSTVPAPDAWPWRWAWADRSPPRTAQSARARPSPGNTTWQYVCGVPNDVGNGTTNMTVCLWGSKRCRQWNHQAAGYTTANPDHPHDDRDNYQPWPPTWRQR